MEIILSIIGIILFSFGGGLLTGYLVWRHSCNHHWVLLEKHNYTTTHWQGGSTDSTESIYQCDKCGKLKTIEF